MGGGRGRAEDLDRRAFLTLAGTTVAGVFVGPGSFAMEAFAQAAETSLVGQLEGPEIITDRALFPKSFGEAPELGELVKAGSLPPAAERIGEDPLVIRPVHEIGRYGGTWRRVFTGPGDFFNGIRALSGPDRMFYYDYTGNKVVPNIAVGYDVEDSGKTTLVKLRRGMHWSDGAPFTADDVMFWYEEIYKNSELIGTPHPHLILNDKEVIVEKVDQHTVALIAPESYYLLPQLMSGFAPGPFSGHALGGRFHLGFFAPAHYLKQFLPKFAGQDAVDKLAADAKFPSWQAQLAARNTWGLNPDLPTVTPWRTVSPYNERSWILERNPYSIWVDAEGNQLPYIGNVSMSLAENLEAANLKAIAGEVDFQARHLDLSKLPVYLENRERGDYKVYLDPAAHGADCGIWCNMSYEEDPEVAKWLHNVDFRRALSLGIERDQLNEAFWLGLGLPGSIIPAEGTPYFPGQEYRTKWSTHDPEQANSLLDSIGLTTKDSDGFRLRTDGGGRLRLTVETIGGQFIQFTKIMEAVAGHWRKIGIHLDVQERERSFLESRKSANQVQLFAFQNDGSDHLFTFPDQQLWVNPNSGLGPLYGAWFYTHGREGKEPPEDIKNILEMFSRAFRVPEDEQVRLGQEIFKAMVEGQYMIGTVGVSPAIVGLRVAKTGMGNVPKRYANSADAMTPSPTRPMTLFWKA